MKTMGTTTPIAKVALGIWMLLPLTTRAETVLAVFTDREAFEKRLGGRLHVIGFDDVETEDGTHVRFRHDRYVYATGAIINGQAEGGQFVSRSFGHAKDFIPSSAPNMYAPGPIPERTREAVYAPAPRPRIKGEAQVTSVTFSVERRGGVVAGFGAVFIDADYPRLCPSYLEAFDSDRKLLGTTGTIAGRNASQLFRGIIAVDVDSGKPVPVVAEVRIVSGDQWPPLDVSEGVVLDDFVFSRPEPRARTNQTLGPSGNGGPAVR